MRLMVRHGQSHHFTDTIGHVIRPSFIRHYLAFDADLPIYAIGNELDDCPDNEKQSEQRHRAAKQFHDRSQIQNGIKKAAGNVRNSAISNRRDNTHHRERKDIRFVPRQIMKHYGKAVFHSAPAYLIRIYLLCFNHGKVILPQNNLR